MSRLDNKRIEHIFKYMDFEELTDGQERLIISFQEQYEKKGYLSEKQEKILEDIFRQANER